MKIAQVAPLFESVPPKFYGGTERVVSYLTEELVKMGHDVTLYASGDSQTSARLVPMAHQALRLDKLSVDPIADHVYLAERVLRDAEQYDIIHSHMDYLFYPLTRRMQTPCLTTLHGRLDISNLYNLYREYAEVPLISISNYQRLPLSWANWMATVHHGLPEDLYRFNEEPEPYLAFIGRISPEKRLDWAIEIAQKANMKLKIAAKVDAVDQTYFKNIIEPLLDQPNIEFIGEINEEGKQEFLSKAYALLFPIDWPEPFGLVIIEAMACGTPTIARLCGAVPEVLDHGLSGYIIKNVDEAVAAVKNITKLSRRKCRETFLGRFTARRMAENYVHAYAKTIDENPHKTSEIGAPHEGYHPS